MYFHYKNHYKLPRAFWHMYDTVHVSNGLPRAFWHAWDACQMWKSLTAHFDTCIQIQVSNRFDTSICIHVSNLTCVFNTRVQLNTCIKYMRPIVKMVQLDTCLIRHVSNWTRVYSNRYCRHASNCVFFVVFGVCFFAFSLKKIIWYDIYVKKIEYFELFVNVCILKTENKWKVKKKLLTNVAFGLLKF
jgi:hypothetical protein